MPIDNCVRNIFSAHGNTIYYQGPGAKIFEYSAGNSRFLGVKGAYPAISPDGKKLAFLRFSWFTRDIQVLDIETGKVLTVFRLFGPRYFWPEIRWSMDNKYLAVREKLDLSPNPLFVVDVLKKKEIAKLKENYACNWFFVSE
ncbi:MAG: PD40 domain-containing protein [Proteobacteria bacterium]|nr:PD40 domain-containing protein [Pseudomonadota bacterium]